VSDPDGGEKSVSQKPPTVQQQRFNAFWELFPNKKSKQDAIKAWAKIKPDEALFTLMMDAIRAQMQSDEWHRENGRYIPHPASWLNGGCWDDVVTPISGGNARAAPDIPPLITPQTFKPSTGGRTFDEYRHGDTS
jgi:hypothetical protein